MICRYSDEDERRVRLQVRVRDWTRAGLIDATQAQQLEARLAVDLKRTNLWLRGVLGLFTAIVVAAVLGLEFTALMLLSRTAIATALAITGAAAIAVADSLAGRKRLYRYGVEEASAALAVTFVAVSAALFVPKTYSGPEWDMIAGLVTAAVGALLVYVRFGFLYAAVAAAICAGLVPSHFGWGEIGWRLGCATVFAAIFFVVRSARRRLGDEFPGDDYAWIQVAPCAGAYLTLNLGLIDVATSSTLMALPGWFYWSTYVATWLIPIAVLAAAIREKDRPLLTTGAALLIGSLATNKPYLLMVRETWDPMLLGVLLMGAAIGIRRWLMAGPGGQRGGYIATPILVRDRELLTALANASILWHAGATQPPAADASPSPFQGGRSGGGGGGAGY
jgi:hypothetical protein